MTRHASWGVAPSAVLLLLCRRSIGARGCGGRREAERAKPAPDLTQICSKIRAYSFAPHTSATMRIRSAIVVGSFAAASGAYPQLSIPPKLGRAPIPNGPRAAAFRPRVGATDGPNAAREPPPAPAPRGAQKSPRFDRRLLGRRRRRRRRAEEERQGPATGVRRLSNGLYRSLLRQRRDHAVAFVASPPVDASPPRRPARATRQWQTKLMDDLATKYAKTDDAAAPASTAAKASSSSSSSSDDSSSDEVVEKKPLGTRLKNVGKKLAFWRK